MKPKKGEVTQIRPFEGDIEIAREISRLTGIEVITILSIAMGAGLRAIKANNWSMPCPLSMKVVPHEITGEPGSPVVFPSAPDQAALAAEENVQYKIKKPKNRLNQNSERKPKQ